MLGFLTETLVYRFTVKETILLYITDFISFSLACFSMETFTHDVVYPNEGWVYS